jgi:hypothetical protein
MNSNDCQTHKIYITARLVQKWYSDMRWYIYIYIPKLAIALTLINI